MRLDILISVEVSVRQPNVRFVYTSNVDCRNIQILKSQADMFQARTVLIINLRRHDALEMNIFSISFSPISSL